MVGVHHAPSGASERDLLADANVINQACGHPEGTRAFSTLATHQRERTQFLARPFSAERPFCAGNA
jgi:hypothetical protein